MLRTSIEGRHIAQQFQNGRMRTNIAVVPNPEDIERVISYIDLDSGKTYAKTTLDRNVCFLPEKSEPLFLNRRRDAFVRGSLFPGEEICQTRYLYRTDVVEGPPLSVRQVLKVGAATAASASVLAGGPAVGVLAGTVAMASYVLMGSADKDSLKSGRPVMCAQADSEEEN